MICVKICFDKLLGEYLSTPLSDQTGHNINFDHCTNSLILFHKIEFYIRATFDGFCKVGNVYHKDKNQWALVFNIF